MNLVTAHQVALHFHACYRPQNGTISGTSGGVLGQLVAQDPAGNMAAGLAELQLPGNGVTGPMYELVGAGVKIQPATEPPAMPKGKASSNSSAVGEVTVNIQHSQCRYLARPNREYERLI